MLAFIFTDDDCTFTVLNLVQAHVENELVYIFGTAKWSTLRYDEGMVSHCTVPRVLSRQNLCRKIQMSID